MCIASEHVCAGNGVSHVERNLGCLRICERSCTLPAMTAQDHAPRNGSHEEVPKNSELRKAHVTSTRRHAPAGRRRLAAFGARYRQRHNRHGRAAGERSQTALRRARSRGHELIELLPTPGSASPGGGSAEIPRQAGQLLLICSFNPAFRSKVHSSSAH
jgi:hypothetical protein